MAYAKTWNLRPGIALTSAQMAALSSDIVWLVEKEVTLADGSVQKVLAPQVYVRLRDGDIDGSGSLLSGKDVDIHVTGDLVNSGTIAGRDIVRLTADNVQNLGGRIHGDAVAVAARTDLNNIGGTISANSALLATAGRDINIATTTRAASSVAGGNSFSRTTIDRVAGLYVTGDGALGGSTLVATAGRDIKLLAGQIGNAGKDGATVLNAGRNVELGTVTTASADNIKWDANNYRKDGATNEVGSQIQAVGDIALKAGGDINIRAANVQAGGALMAQAGNDIHIVAGVTTATLDEGHQRTDKGFLHSELVTTRATLASAGAVGSSLGGATVALGAGRDIGVLGSAVVGDGATTLAAGRNVTIAAATETLGTTSHESVKESGFLSGNGFGLSYGERTTTTDQDHDATTQSGQARSTVGSTGGDLTVKAGNALHVSGGDLAAGRDMALAGKSVTIDPGQDDSHGLFKTKTTQDGFTLAVGGSVVAAIQAGQAMGAASKGKDTRVKALAAATAAMAAKKAAEDIAANGVSVKISLTAGHSESEQTQVTADSSHSGSTLAAGNNLSISASGGGKDSNINIVGSDISAKNNLALAADNQVNLLAAQDTESQHSKSTSMSAAAGVAAGYSSKGGLAVGFTGSVAASRANEDGDGVTQLNSHVTAGQQVSISSGGDTNVKGAVVSGAQVVGDVKGNLNLESLQDTARFDSKSQSFSVSATVGYGVSVDVSLNQSKIHNDYASVQEQSGIRAGDGGFQIKVGGNTDLKGAVIGATAAGAAASALDTGTLTHSDIANHTTMEASSIGVSASATSGGTGGGTERGKGAAVGGKNLTDVGKSGTSANTPIVVSTSEHDASTTRSGIGAGTLTVRDDAAQVAATGKDAAQTVAGINRKVETGVDTSGKIANNFDKKSVQATLDATAAFVQAAAPFAANAVGDIGKAKVDAAQREAANYGELAKDAAARGDTDKANAYSAQAAEAATTAKNWDDNGVYRVGLHVAAQGLIGGMAGGGAGALGAATGVVAGNQGQQLGKAMGEAEAKKLGLEGDEKDKLVNTYQQTMATLGGALGGLVASGASGQGGMNALSGVAQGANAAATVDIKNRQMHPKEMDWIAKNSKDFSKTLADKLGRPVSELEAMQWLTKAGEADVDNVYQKLASSQIGARNTTESEAFFAAKQYISQNGKGSFVDESGQQQKLFVAKNGDFDKPAVYSEYRNNKAYRDYLWTVTGDNLRPDKPTDQELAIYKQREGERQMAEGKNLVTQLLPSLIAGAVGSVRNRSPSSASTSGANAESQQPHLSAVDESHGAEGGAARPANPASVKPALTGLDEGVTVLTKAEAVSRNIAPCCFAPGTQVATPAGYKAIETLKEGDQVWTRRDDNSGETFAATVTATHIRDDQPIYRLTLKRQGADGESRREALLVTPGHPFYISGRGFVSAIDLKAGDLLTAREHAAIAPTVESLELVQQQGRTHNLTVDVGHTFFVGAFETWVHNVGPCVTCSNGSCTVHATDGRNSPTVEITGSAQNLYDQLPTKLRTKTVSTDGNTKTISGYGASLPDGYTYVDPNAIIQRAADIGHDLRAAGAMDQGIPGQYNASHAEKQTIFNNPNASQVDVSRAMCTDCQSYYQAEAKAQGRPLVVSDPNGVRTFYPNGDVILDPHKK